MTGEPVELHTGEQRVEADREERGEQGQGMSERKTGGAVETGALHRRRPDRSDGYHVVRPERRLGGRTQRVRVGPTRACRDTHVDPAGREVPGVQPDGALPADDPAGGNEPGDGDGASRGRLVE